LSLHFPIFLRFSIDFTRISKITLLLKLHAEVPTKIYAITNMPLVYIKTLGRTPSLAMWPLGWGRCGSGQIRRGQRRSRPCRGTGRRERSPRARLCSELGWKDTRRWRTVMTGGDGRGGRDSGEGSARAGQQATLGAPGSPRGGARVIG
jgi:hypothetical protein